jgi:hypothetical protein
LTRPVAMYATVSCPRVPQAYALVLKSESKVKEVYILNEPGRVVSLARLSAGKHHRPSFPLIYNVHQPRLFCDAMFIKPGYTNRRGRGNVVLIDLHF